LAVSCIYVAYGPPPALCVWPAPTAATSGPRPTPHRPLALFMAFMASAHRRHARPCCAHRCHGCQALALAPPTLFICMVCGYGLRPRAHRRHTPGPWLWFALSTQGRGAPRPQALRS
jgi:hypothetical protein